MILFPACQMDLFDLPSGAKYCRAKPNNLLGFDDADQFCKEMGFSGLAEPEIQADYTRMAGINTCEGLFKMTLFIFKQFLTSLPLCRKY